MATAAGSICRSLAAERSSWILRYKRACKTRHLGLGPLAVVSLREARERAINARRLLLDGHDPIERKFALRSAEKLKATGTMSFDPVCRCLHCRTSR